MSSSCSGWPLPPDNVSPDAGRSRVSNTFASENESVRCSRPSDAFRTMAYSISSPVAFSYERVYPQKSVLKSGDQEKLVDGRSV